VADEIRKVSRRVARGYGGQAIPTLEMLAADLEGSDHRLLGTDLLAAFPPEAVIPDADSRLHGGGVRALQLARDVLVFVPVLVTWWQLRFALEAYNAAVAAAQAQHQATTSFLLGWIRGFDGKTWSLASSALLVAVVIALIIGMTVVAESWQALQGQRESHEADRAWLASLLVQGTLLLTQVRRPAAGTFTRVDIQSMVEAFYQNSARLSVELTKTRDQIAEVLATGPAAQFTKAIEDWRRSASALEALGQSLTVPSEILGRLQEIQRDFSQSGQQLADNLRNLVRQLGDQTLAAGQEAAAHTQLARDVSGATREVGQAFDTFTARLEQLGSLVSDLREAIENTRMTRQEEW
jgi:hypothetical protein